MEITSVRISFCKRNTTDTKAICSIAIDDNLIIHSIRIRGGKNGLFIEFPRRELTDSCPQCDYQNYLLARFCNKCGTKLQENRFDIDDNNKPKVKTDIIHPTNTEFRKIIQDAILKEYHIKKSEGSRGN